MKILITGGAGFIGSWVVDKFAEQGHEIVLIDDLSSGTESNINSKAEFIKCDIRDKDLLTKVFADFKPDVVDHHAAQINVRTSVDDPVYDAQINIIGSLNLLELCRVHSVKKFIFASTGGAIYGEPELLPAPEDTLPMPISPYGTSKYAVEKYIGYYHQVYGLEYVALRYANVYGPRQNPHGEAGVVAIFCNKILANEPCMIFGDGTQSRDYVYVSDVAEANLLALSADCGCYNIGTGVETTVIRLTELLKGSVSGFRVDVDHTDARDGEVQSISLDNSYSRQKLGWSPDVNIEQGIERTWDWFLQNSKK
ncbi:MAG: NAD-dependent epimerase/dehydratase family protein [Candidatus Dadabacteria bacterium]|nr:NAD-dependent epimerase/dehydratase family protein [Candidatus Dadabacteria bacterium]NIS08204.1 NAD-dependent epimerase/dehydratase family protein [Candidatus Dadabacteria bacterium]NIV41450.1 NAD-dependent epimerase/dehydratase family protein [Candidatus Dadabacteria bacterium]NIY21694.1 NAD-dependent epimerase/dehydratase family protein [Candidatus Dadabacteria bacterium]